MKRYLFEFSAALTLYMVALIGSMVVLTHYESSGIFLRGLIAVTPIIPAGLICWVIVRQLRRLDEMHLRIQFEALGFAFAASALLTFSYGFMENVGAPHLPWFWVWPVMGLTWVVGLMLAKRRYQ